MVYDLDHQRKAALISPAGYIIPMATNGFMFCFIWRVAINSPPIAGGRVI